MTTNAKRFSTNISNLARDIDELCKDSHGLNEHEKLCSEQSMPKYELQPREQEIAEKNREQADLRRANDGQITSLGAEIKQLKPDEQVLTRKYHARFKAWGADKQRYSNDVERLSRIQKECQHWKEKADRAELARNQLHQDAEKRSGETKDYQSKINQLQRDLQMKSLMAEEAVEKKVECQKKLVEASEELGILTIDQRQRFGIL